jgi:hypothetical protein
VRVFGQGLRKASTSSNVLVNCDATWKSVSVNRRDNHVRSIPTIRLSTISSAGVSHDDNATVNGKNERRETNWKSHEQRRPAFHEKSFRGRHFGGRCPATAYASQLCTSDLKALSSKSSMDRNVFDVNPEASTSRLTCGCRTGCSWKSKIGSGFYVSDTRRGT